MQLTDTIELMTSNDYKERFKAEYYQLKIRYNKLSNIIQHWNYLDFTPMSDKATLESQLLIMNEYLKVLRKRATLENIFIDKEGVE